MPSPLTSRPRRSRYEGFRGYLKAVGTGERGRRSLDREEARDAMRAVLAGEASPAQAAAFLLALRIKGETPAEVAGVTDVLRERATPLVNRSGRTLVACAGGFDGCVNVPQLSLVTGIVAAAAGAGVVLHCGTTLGPKYGVLPTDVLVQLGGEGRPGAAASEEMLERAGITLVRADASLDGWDALRPVRDDVGLRLVINSAEKLVDWFAARRFIVGYHHNQYAERLCATGALLGAEHIYAVRGAEGSDILRPGRPTVHRDGERLDLPVQPGDRHGQEGGADVSAELTRAVLAGEADRVTMSSVVLSAGLRLHACGQAPTVMRGVAQARTAIADGRAGATLDALVG